MARIARLSLTAVLFSASIALIGCGKTVVYTKTPALSVEAKHHGPPPHAPAHGYRHKHSDGAVLVYESGIGVYVVRGYSDIYFYGDNYYRLHKGSFTISGHVDGPWHKVAVKKLPRGLRKKLESSGKGKGKYKKTK
jgi:hypothetical protein